MSETVKNLHRELARKFQLHGSRVEQMWMFLGQEQREKIMTVTSHDGLIPKDPLLDTSLGNVYHLHLSGIYETLLRFRLTSSFTFSGTEQLPRSMNSTLAASMELL
jgi:hypothetical protein